MRNFLAVLFCCSCFAYADSQPYKLDAPPTPPPAPWLTGSLISANGYAVPYGNVVLQIYNYANVNTGAYDSQWNSVSTPNFYQYALQVYAYLGLTPWMDIQIVPQTVCNTSQGTTATEFSDLPIALDFQLFDSNADSYFPGVKLSFKETFPTGRYKGLNPYKNGTQVSGAGSYGSNASIYFYKVYNTNGSHFLSVNCNFGYTVNTAVNVHGFNAYGGGYGCSGKVYPGSSLQAILSFEYTLSQNWVLALDNVFTHNFKTRFYGSAGTLTDGSPASVASPSSDWLAFAPSIEYNFNSTYALNIGAYVTAIGRNATEFRNGIVEFVCSY